MFILRAQPHSQSLFLFPIVFGINLIHFFDEKKDGAAGNSIVSVLRSPVTPFDRSKTKNANCFEERNIFGNRKCELSPSRGEKLRCKFLARKSAKIFANTKVQIFGKERCKTHRQFQRLATKGAKFLANFSATKVTSLPSLLLSLSLSLCVSLSLSLYYRKRESASYIVREVHSVRERERDTERERKTEVTSPLSR